MAKPSELYAQMTQHAREEAPREACGLVVDGPEGVRLVRAKNLARDPFRDFDLDPDAWLELTDDESVIAFYHSHPVGPSEHSDGDIAASENSGLPCYLVNLPTAEVKVYEPCGYEAPYTGRVYVHGSRDCFSLVRDWFRLEMGIHIDDFDRRDGWWSTGQNLYLDNFASQGFVEVSPESPVLRGDVFLIQVGARVPNHAAIALGDGTILHHVYGRLSTRDPFGGYWARHTFCRVRHVSKMGTT